MADGAPGTEVWRGVWLGEPDTKGGFLHPAASPGRLVAQVIGPWCQAMALPAPRLQDGLAQLFTLPLKSHPSAYLPIRICQEAENFYSPWGTPPSWSSPHPTLSEGSQQVATPMFLAHLVR